MTAPDSIVIAGAGQSGFWLVKTLRQEGYGGPLTLIGDEPHLPYDRPPLSKAVLTGEAEPESAYFANAEDFAAFEADFIRPHRVTAIDRPAKSVTLDDGRTVAYGHLFIATGTRARTLNTPGADKAPIHYLRSLEESLTLKAEFTSGRRVIVIGGGFIGLEVAAAAKKAGALVSVIEAGPRVMARTAGPEVSAHFEALHRSHGIEVLTGMMPERFETGANGCRIHCADGTTVDGDIIIAGIGAVPNDEIAAKAGLKCENGVWVDEFGRTEDPHISAAGDVTCHYNPRLDCRIRLETWQNAQNQAVHAARAVMGDARPYQDVPWGWSDQFGVNLQMLGAPSSFDGGVVRGTPESGSFSVFYLDGQKVAGINTVDAVRDMAVARRLMATNADVDPRELADPESNLKDLLRR